MLFKLLPQHQSVLAVSVDQLQQLNNTYKMNSTHASGCYYKLPSERCTVSVWTENSFNMVDGHQMQGLTTTIIWQSHNKQQSTLKESYFDRTKTTSKHNAGLDVSSVIPRIRLFGTSYLQIQQHNDACLSVPILLKDLLFKQKDN